MVAPEGCVTIVKHRVKPQGPFSLLIWHRHTVRSDSSFHNCPLHNPRLFWVNACLGTGQRRNLILHVLCFFSWPDLVLLKFEAYAQTQRDWSRELSAIHKTTTFLLALTQSDSSSVPVSPGCTDPLLQEHPCSPDSFRMPCSTSEQMPFPDTNGSQSTLETYRSLLPRFLHFLGSLSTGEMYWWAAAPSGAYLN